MGTPSTSDYEYLRTAAVSNGGLHVTTMDKLKRAQGAGRLGVNVRSAISRTLESHGLGHLPASLPPNQEDPVRLYVKGTQVADVIDAVLHPSGRGDEVLRSVGSDEGQKTLEQIRELVCG